MNLEVLSQAGGPSSWGWGTVASLVIGVVLLVILLIMAQFFRLWLQAYMSNAGVTMLDLIGMRLRKVDTPTIVLSRIQLVKSGIHEVSVNELESHYLAGGRVTNVTRAMIAANRAAIELDWRKACAIDLAGRDILDAVNTSVNPKVIDCPGPTSGAAGTDRLDAVSKDGIRLLIKGRVTVRTNIRQLIGGATEETIIARVGQAIVSAIGSATSYKAVLENPDKIARKALESGLDSGTAFEILSVDIADVSVAGVSQEANVGAKLQAEQAEADKRRFQAEAEKRRAMAIALAAENKAKIEENRAVVVLAEAEVPKAMAEAFRLGHLGIMDYYRMKNIQADTAMRDSIGREDGQTEPKS
ncbi:MAG: flotillin-like protein FloA [Planctomycetes bacterium]|nr:flotillin-like protein FloA [Planctomycetota bacterium]